MKELTQDLLKESFVYREGNLYWKIVRPHINIGDLAGYQRKDGYREISINDKPYFVHRLIFIYCHGFVPKFLDHIDGDPSNNHIENLRDATLSQNQWNRKPNKSYNGEPVSSQFKGVSWDNRDNRWYAQIKVNGKSKHIGMFVSEIEAAKAYNRAALKDHPEFARLNIIK